MLLRIGVVMSVVVAVIAAAAAVFLWLQPEPGVERAAQKIEPAGVTSRGEEREAEPEEEARALPAQTEEGWPRPSDEELRRLVEEPRRFAPDPGAALTMTIEALGIRDAPVFDSDSAEALNAGVAHVPETSMPWDEAEQTNVYLAAHRLGYEGTGSRLLFYDLDRLGRGDRIVLKGRGETFRYRVNETLVVDPTDSWVMGQVPGRHMVSLQTCTPIPTFEKRLVVRAEMVRADRP